VPVPQSAESSMSDAMMAGTGVRRLEGTKPQPECSAAP
jgi:hypothetical protein